MAAISRHHADQHGASLDGVLRVLFYVAMALAAIAVAVPAAIATVG